MTEAGWTGNAPTKEGWYWWKRTENDNPVIVWVNAFHPDKQLRAEMISGRRELLTHFTGLFNGPLSPTDRQQGRVEGLREAERIARNHKGGYTLDVFTAKLIADPDGPWTLGSDIAEKLAQAAQDE